MTRSPATRHETPAHERIVATARQLFTERGFHQTAMADLASEANVSVGAIYRSFRSKADIIHAIVVMDSQTMLGGLQSDADKVRREEIPIETAIEQIILRRLSDKDEALTHEILAEAHRNPQVAAAVSDFCVEYRGIFSELAKLANPSLSGDQLEGAADLLISCLFGIGHRELTKPRLDEAMTAKVATQLIMRALSA